MKKMNTKYFIISVLSLTLLSSCVKNDITGDTIVTKEFVASVCESTKTTINDDCSVDWAKNDIIRYFSADKGNVGEYIVSEDGHTTDISASIGINDTYFVAAYGGTGISSNNTDGFTLEGAMPKTQDGSFKNAHVAVAKTTNLKDKYISFNNLTSLVSFSFSRDDVHYVVFKATDGTKINDNGKLDIVFDGNAPSAQISKDGSSETRINCGGAGTFYLSTLACTMESFMIDCYDINDVCLGEVNSKGSLVLARNYIVELGQLDGLMEPKYETTTDLSLKGTANCYIVSAPGKYKIKATVKGGSTESIEGTPAKAEVLWESFMTSTAPSAGDLIARASYSDGYITFSTPTTLNNGNAAIAIKDKEDQILWSWHIWICEGYDIEETAQVYKYNAGTMMDRNLGALSATPGDTLTYGLYYQWGRKDPFMANYYYYKIDKKIHIESTPRFPLEPHTDVNTSTVAFSVAHPMTMIQRNELNYSWCYTGTAKADTTLWRSSTSPKGVYDPCPVGWRVPDGGDNNVWSRAFGLYKEDYNFGQYSANFSVYDIPQVNKGINLGSGNGLSADKQVGTDDVIWYPDAGQIVVSNGSMYVYNRNVRGFCWACPNYGYYFCNLATGLNVNGGLNAPTYWNNSAGSYSVRCIKEGSQGPLVLPPNVKTASVSAVSATAAMCGGNVVSAGSASVTGRGVVWGEVKGPTLENCAGKTSNGSGKGEFTSKLTGLSPSTKYYVRAYATNSAGTRYGEGMEFTTGKEGPDYVDLGLSVKWATFNLGATDPEECGDYYAWGELEPYYADGYSQESPCTHWRNMTTGGGNTDLSGGYCWTSYSKGGPSSFVEWSNVPYAQKDLRYEPNQSLKSLVLKPDRDVATVKWGGSWRMPTHLDLIELFRNTTQIWTDDYDDTGVSGYVITSTVPGFSGKSIFLPAAGDRYDTVFGGLGTHGWYWCSNMQVDGTKNCANCLYFVPDSFSYSYSDPREFGYSIRPVLE